MSSKATPRTSTTIPYTPTSPGWTHVHPRPLRPIHPYPSLDTIQTPALPAPLRPSVFHTTSHGVYRLSTHFVPAAYPRSTPDIPLPVIPAYVPSGSSSERHAKMDALVKEAQEIQDAYAEGKLGGKPSEKLLWNCVNRYVRTPTRSGTGITLFLAHANGFHKEASGCFVSLSNPRQLIALGVGRRGRRCFGTCSMRLQARWLTRCGRGTPSSMGMPPW